MSGSTGHRDKRIADYVRNRADEETARQLEIDMLDDDELFEAVQAEAMLQEGLALSGTEDDSARTTKPRRGWVTTTGWALAATFAAVAVGLGIHSVQLDRQIEALQSPTAGLPVITLYDQRSALLGETEEPTSLAIGSQGALVEIDVSTAETDRFRLTLQTERRRYEWEAVEKDERGYVTVMLPPHETVISFSLISQEGKKIREFLFSQ
jgi:hypothetical protein